MATAFVTALVGILARFLVDRGVGWSPDVVLGAILGGVLAPDPVAAPVLPLVAARERGAGAGFEVFLRVSLDIRLPFVAFDGSLNRLGFVRWVGRDLSPAAVQIWLPEGKLARESLAPPVVPAS